MRKLGTDDSLENQQTPADVRYVTRPYDSGLKLRSHVFNHSHVFNSSKTQT